MNLETFLNFGRKIIPKPIFNFFQPAYHLSLGGLGAFLYGFPSRKLKVIGVTGTKGKTTTCNLITDILNYCGFRTGMMSTVNFKIGEKNWVNQSKQTMLGRFKLQKMLRQMAKEGCEYAVIETSSEGILQHRHCFIDYQAAVFTNLSPEHLERHGSFDNYREAKIKLFEKVAKRKDGVGVYNLDDENVEHFLAVPVERKYGYEIKSKVPLRSEASKSQKSKLEVKSQNLDYVLEIRDYELTPQGTKFTANGIDFGMKLLGQFNIYNAAAAICAALSQGISLEKIREALIQIKPVPGRMEVIDKGQDFTVVVDYAHEPVSLESVYSTLADLHKPTANAANMICVLGAAGGGRDKWKRPELGKIAAKYCQHIILTNEDPYDENPNSILEEIELGFSQIANHKSQIKKVIDRREAIHQALSLARLNDIVVITGKGGEVWMCVENNKKIPWDEKKIVGEELEKLL